MKHHYPSLRESKANAAIQSPKRHRVDCFALLAMTLMLTFPVNAQTTPEFCAMIKDRNSVTYTSGIDVHGKKVVSADLNNSFAKTLFPVQIPIQIDVQDRFNRTLLEGAIIRPQIAHFDIHEDGRVMYGDKDLTGKAQELCQPPKQESYNE